MEYNTWRMGVDIIQFATTVGVWVYAWRKSRQKITEERFQGIEKKVESHGSRIVQLENDVKHRPDCQYHQGFEGRLDKINVGMAKIEGNVKSGIAKLEGRMEGVGSSLDLIQQHLLSGGK